MGSGLSSSSINFAFINQCINRYFSMFLLFFGTIGNFLNLLVFTRKTFRNNICVNYFLASTISDSFIILSGVLPRLLGGYGMDLSQTSFILCKLKFFTIYQSGYAAAWFTCLACIERYLSSSVSVYKRHLITMKRAKLSMVFVLLFGIIIFGEQFHCIDINQNLYGAPQSCYQLKSNVQCQIADSLMQFIFEMFIPAVVMITFGVLTLQNVRQRKRRVNVANTTKRLVPLFAVTNISHPSVIQQSINITIGPNNQPATMGITRTAQKREMQLIMMLLMQVVVFIVSTFPISIYKIYSIATIDQTRSVLRASIENTIFNVFVLCLFLTNNINFYIYTLCGATFRKELLKLFHLANGLLPRLLGGFGMDLSQTSSVLCKLKFFTIYHSGYTAAWFTCLACIERYLSSSTSVYKRHLITMKRAKLSMIFVILFGTIVFGEQFYCIDINQNLYGAPQSCYQLKSNIQCQIADSLMQFIFEMFIPAIVMTIFGVLTLQNVRQRKRRVNVIKTTNRSIPLFALRTINHPSVTQQSINMTVGPNKQPARMEVNRTTQKREMQLIMMLLMQVAFFVVSSCPISAYKIYSIATINQARPILRASIENTVFNVCVLCSFLNNNINFYIYTLCGATFRKELLKLFRLAK
ncbi:unnamed protein product [Adineta steineri]|uniref:G-protein coupled receptors family 1 profile domain-containing protein n=1 Tax=Adineta steineri TaxID=433720 RepID=A0A818YMZ7_9BILA|nr:unnamed protein product [Adineta steineri]